MFDAESSIRTLLTQEINRENEARKLSWQVDDMSAVTKHDHCLARLENLLCKFEIVKSAYAADAFADRQAKAEAAREVSQ